MTALAARWLMCDGNGGGNDSGCGSGGTVGGICSCGGDRAMELWWTGWGTDGVSGLRNWPITCRLC